MLVLFSAHRHAAQQLLQKEHKTSMRLCPQVQKEVTDEERRELARCDFEEEQSIVAVQAEVAQVEEQVQQQPVDKAAAGDLARKRCANHTPCSVIAA